MAPIYGEDGRELGFDPGEDEARGRGESSCLGRDGHIAWPLDSVASGTQRGIAREGIRCLDPNPRTARRSTQV